MDKKTFRFDTEKALRELRLSDGVLETGVSTAKLVGKHLFNATAVTTGFVFTKALPTVATVIAGQILSNARSTEEQKENARNVLEMMEKRKNAKDD